jgi:sodium/bile acid cotransporter 7
MSLLLKHWFLAALAADVLLALLEPRLGASGGLLRSELWVWLATPAIFLISGLLLPSTALRQAMTHWRLHLFVQGFSLGFCTLLFGATAAAARACGLPPAICLGIAVLGCLPTTITSGVAFTRAAGGDEAAALVSAALGNLGGLAVTPALLLALGRGGTPAPVGAIVLSLLWQMVLPVVVGQVLQLALREWAQRWKKPLGNSSSVLMLLLIWAAFSTTAQRGFGVSADAVVLAIVLCVLLHAIAIACALSASGWRWLALERPTRTAATICATQKTAAMGIPLLALCYAGDPGLGLITLPLLVYHPLQLVVAASMAPWWRRWSSATPTAAAA